MADDEKNGQGEASEDQGLSLQTTVSLQDHMKVFLASVDAKLAEVRKELGEVRCARDHLVATFEADLKQLDSEVVAKEKLQEQIEQEKVRAEQFLGDGWEGGAPPPTPQKKKGKSNRVPIMPHVKEAIRRLMGNEEAARRGVTKEAILEEVYRISPETRGHDPSIRSAVSTLYCQPDGDDSPTPMLRRTRSQDAEGRSIDLYHLTSYVGVDFGESPNLRSQKKKAAQEKYEQEQRAKRQGKSASVQQLPVPAKQEHADPAPMSDEDRLLYTVSTYGSEGCRRIVLSHIVPYGPDALDEKLSGLIQNGLVAHEVREGIDWYTATVATGASLQA